MRIRMDFHGISLLSNEGDKEGETEEGEADEAEDDEEDGSEEEEADETSEEQEEEGGRDQLGSDSPVLLSCCACDGRSESSRMLESVGAGEEGRCDFDPLPFFRRPRRPTSVQSLVI